MYKKILSVWTCGIGLKRDKVIMWMYINEVKKLQLTFAMWEIKGKKTFLNLI